jgi:hypothetical protein
MALQCTPYPIKTATSTTTAKSCIDPDNPATTPSIVDKNGNLLFTWNSSTNKFEPQLGTGTSANILPSGSGFGVDETYQSLLNLNEDIFTNNTTAIINKLPDNQKNLFASSNTYNPYNKLVERQQAAAAAANNNNNNNNNGDDDSVTSVTGLGLINNVKPKDRGTLIYPLNIERNGQDYIKFRGINYIPQTTGSNSYVLERSAPQGTNNVETIVTIILPIQPTIMDTNTVSWGEEKFGILEMIGSGISLDVMNGNASIDDMINKFTNTITSDGNIKSEIVEGIKASLAQKAIGSNNNLLSRLTGAVTNPNLTLLFNSPDLRNFSFNFKLSPRTQDEGTKVRKIIRAFKELMAVQRTAGNLFLEAPCVFEIEYIRGKDLINDPEKKDSYDIHPSLNRIKTCALRNFSVNYTPSGSYMTYTDKEGTMTSYDLTMSFTELDPIYYDDYVEVSEVSTPGKDKIPFDQIGY